MNLWVLTLLVGSAIAAPSFEVHHEQQTTRNVGQFLDDLFDEIGLTDILPWIQEMIITDPDVDRFIEYLRSPAFERIEDQLRKCPDYIAVKQDLKDEGVDLVDLLRRIRNFISGDSYRTKTKYYKIKPRHSLAEILDEVIERLDVEKVINIVHEQFHGNPNIKKIVDFLNSNTYKGIVACMKQSPDFQELLEKLKDEDVDLENIIDTVKEVLEEHVFYSRHTRSIASLLEDLIDEMGFRDLIPWVKEMIETDPDVQRIVDYLRGPIFLRIEDHLRNCPGYPAVRDKLKEEGVDLVQILQDVRDYFTGGDFYKIQPRRTLGDILQDVLDRVDVSHVWEVVQEKIANDPDMKKVINFLKGEDFHGIITCMGENKDVQDLIKRLKEQEDFDVVGLIEMVKAFLGGL